MRTRASSSVSTGKTWPMKVERYFGGILLGAGGLARAYARSAKDALDAAGVSAVRRSSVSTGKTWPMKVERFSVNSVSEGRDGTRYSDLKHEDKLPPEYQEILMREGKERAALDYIAGMTDTYAPPAWRRQCRD